MQKEITQLLHLLNKGVESLPATTQQLITEYAHQQTVMAITSGVLLLLCIAFTTIGVYLVAKYTDNYQAEQKWIVGIVLSIVFGFGSMLALGGFIECINHALAPTISLIQSLR